jgi:hypothetical protein
MATKRGAPAEARGADASIGVGADAGAVAPAAGGAGADAGAVVPAAPAPAPPLPRELVSLGTSLTHMHSRAVFRWANGCYNPAKPGWSIFLIVLLLVTCLLQAVYWTKSGPVVRAVWGTR